MASVEQDGINPSEENEKESYFNLGKSGDQIVGALAKAYFQGQKGGSQSRIMEEPDKQQSLFQASGALMPLYDPAGLAIVFENSSCLRSCVDAYVTNIDGFGHQFIPIIDLSHPSAFEAVRNAIRLERKAIKKAALLAPEQTEVEKAARKLPDEPTDADVKARMEDLAVEIAQEKMELEVFFDNCTIDMPFAGPEGLRGHTRQNLEIIGNAYWEVLRDGLGKVAQFNYIPSTSMRLGPTDDNVVEVEVDVRVSPLTWKKLKVRKRFRRFVQCWLDNTKAVYFKEFGDPRCISADTGRVYKDFAELEEKEGKDRPADKPVREATEVFWFKIDSLRTAYGAPRWIGTLLAVLGNRQAEEMNFIYFENRSVPPLAVLVSGGRLAADSVTKLEDHIRNNIKGARNSHKILLIEADPASSMQQSAGAAGIASRMKIELKPLTEAQLSDAQFLSYDESNRDKIGQAFRLPRMLRGDVRDFNRSCYSEDTETLTESGWKTYDQITDGEKIAAYNKDTGEILFVVPEKKLVYDVVDETMWHFSNKYTDFCVTAEHTTLYSTDSSWQWVVGTAATMPQNNQGECRVPFAGKASAEVLAVAPECDGAYRSAEMHGGRSGRVAHMATTLSCRSLSLEKYTGKVYCFSVPEYGFFVTRRNGKVAIQGNTASASIDFAEVQVFGPIRQEFDWLINKRILPALGARYHLFRSNSPSVRDPQALAEMIERMIKSSVLTPEEGRALCGDVFNHEFPVLGERWTKQPIAMTLAGVHTEHGALVPAREDIKGGRDKEGLETFNANGGMSAPGAGATQEALGVSKKDKASLAALMKDVFAGEHHDDDEDEEEDEEEIEDETARLHKVRIRALLKLHKHFKDQERARAKAAYDKMEKVVVRIPEEEMRALFEKEV